MTAVKRNFLISNFLSTGKISDKLAKIYENDSKTEEPLNLQKKMEKYTKELKKQNKRRELIKKKIRESAKEQNFREIVLRNDTLSDLFNLELEDDESPPKVRRLNNEKENGEGKSRPKKKSRKTKKQKRKPKPKSQFDV